jgi:hypothetical protein
VVPFFSIDYASTTPGTKAKSIPERSVALTKVIADTGFIGSSLIGAATKGMAPKAGKIIRHLRKICEAADIPDG